MRYYKQIENGYIVAIGINIGGIEITEEEYNHIMEVIQSAPQDDDEYEYLLKEDLTWEKVKKEKKTDAGQE